MTSRKQKTIGVAFIFAWFMLGGLGHFVATGFFVSIVPPYIPYPYLAVIVSGIFEILGALGLLVPATRKAAAYGLFLLTLAVTPANIHMWLHPESFANIPEFLLSVRLVIQAGLLWLIWWSVQPTTAKADR